MHIASTFIRRRFEEVIVMLALGISLATLNARSTFAQENQQDLLPDLPQNQSDASPQPPSAASSGQTTPGANAPPSAPVVPPGRTPPRVISRQPQPPQQSPFRFARARVGRVPSIFGDFFNPPTTLVLNRVDNAGGPNLLSAELPTSGALRRTKISDNGRVLPTDRVYFLYNHFNNAVQTPALDPTGQFFGRSVRESVDRYTFGYERTFFSERSSIELRVPFASATNIDVQPQFDTAVIVPGQEFGNMNVAFKGLVHETSNFASAIGLAVDIPTGEDINGVLGMQSSGSLFPGDGTAFHIENDTVYLQPFAAALFTPSDRSFIQGFVLVDVPTSGDRVTMTDPTVGTTGLGRLDYATYLHADVAAGRWLIQDSPGLVRGLAGIVEIHSSPMVSNPGSVVGDADGFTVALGQPDSLNLLSLTAGLHAQLGANTTLRVGGVVPLLDRPDRTYDAELIVQVNRFLR